MRAFPMWYRFVATVHRNLPHIGELPTLLWGLKAFSVAKSSHVNSLKSINHIETTPSWYDFNGS